MMICPFEECEGRTTLPSESATHLIIAIGHDNRPYIHGPLATQDKPYVERMLMEAARALNINLHELADKLDQINNVVPKVVTVQ